MDIKYKESSDLLVELTDHRVSYHDSGISEIPIIFIHGFPFNKGMWDNQLDYFSKTRRVISYDIRGFGQSESGNKKFSIEQFADDLIEFMDNLNISKAIVCGLSMGGYILLNAVQRFPERFEKIILSDTQCIADTPEVKEKRMSTISQIIAGGLEDFAEGFVGKIFAADTLKSATGLVNKTKAEILNTNIETITATLAALANRSESCSTLLKIQIPVLIICGDVDTITPLSQSQLLKASIPDVELQIIYNAGHLSNLEQPDDYNRYIDNFISK